jgi:hypothetical protein
VRHLATMLLMAAGWSAPRVEVPTARTAAIVPKQGLAWGRLLRGVASRVQPGDVLKRGQIDFVGTGRLQVRLDLPSMLVSRTGGRFPVSFRAGDLVLQYTRNGGTSFPIPTEPIVILTNPGRGDASLYIGGTASPAASQATGEYTGTITVVAAQLAF